MGNPLVTREQKIKWLLARYDELSLANYPWGLSRTEPKQRVERYNRELAIFKLMQKAGLFSDHTRFMLDCNLNNLIIDTRARTRWIKKYRINKK